MAYTTIVEEVGEDAFIAIPEELLTQLDWKEGDTLKLSFENGSIKVINTSKVNIGVKE